MDPVLAVTAEAVFSSEGILDVVALTRWLMQNRPRRPALREVAISA